MKKLLIIIFSICSVAGFGQTILNPGGSNSVSNINNAISTAPTTASAVADTYTVTITGATLTANKAYTVVFNSANTGSATINISDGSNPLGAVTIKKYSSGSLVNLSAGDISAGEGKRLRYNGTNFVIEGGSGSSGGGGVTSVDVQPGTSGSDINTSGGPITSSGTITINVPDAGASARGVITTGTQTIAGAKTFSTAPTMSGANITSATIANASLTNSAITIAGASTALGSSITLDGITGLSTTGLVQRTGANTLSTTTAPTITGTNITGIPESGVTNLTSDLALKAPLASPTFTGTVTLPSGQTLTAPSSLGVQQQALNMNSHLINNVTDPVSAQDAATKAYTDLQTGTSVPVGSIFTESWANLSQWSNVGTPGASVTSNQLSFSGTASTSTNYIQCSGYGKTNFENMQFTWTETVGTINGTSTGIAFALQSNSTLGSSYQNHIMVNIDLSSGASKGKIVWYYNGAIKQTSSNLTVPATGNVLNCKLILYPDKYYFEYNINGGAPIGDTWLINTGIGYSSVLNNASEFAFFNIGGGSSHSVGAFAASCSQGKGADLLMVGNSIFSGYSCNYFYNRAITQIQKRVRATIEVYARPSNSVNDLNLTEIALLNPKKIIALPSSNDLIANPANAFTDMQTFVTALGALSTTNAPSGYSVSNGNLVLGTEMPRVASTAIATYNTNLISTYGIANIINFYGVASKNSTSMATDYSYDGVHPNDVLHSIMADMIINYFGFTRKTTYTNNEFYTYSPPGALNTNAGPEVYFTNSSNFKSICFNCFVSNSVFKARDLTNSLIIGADNTNGMSIYVNNGNTVGNTITASKRFGIDNSGGISTGSTSSVTYRNTNGGSDVVSHFMIDPSSSVSSTSAIGYSFDATNGFGFTVGNGTRRIQFGAIKPVATTTTAGSEAGDLTFFTQSGGTAATEKFRITSGGGFTMNSTVTAGGTTGNQTINKPSGTVNIAAAGTSVTVTNSLVTTSSIVFAVIRTNDTTAVIKNVVPGSGSFVITLNAAATAETSIGFFVIN